MSFASETNEATPLCIHRSEAVGYVDTPIAARTLDEMAAGVRALAAQKGENLSFADARERAKETITQQQRWSVMQAWIDERKVSYDNETHEWVVCNGGPTVLRFAVEGQRVNGGTFPSRAVSEQMIAQISLVLQ